MTGGGCCPRSGFEVKFFDAALGEHADAAAYEWADVFLGVGRLGGEDELFEEDSEHPEGSGVEFGGGAEGGVVGGADGGAEGFDYRGEEGHVVISGLVLGLEEEGLAEGGGWEILDGAEPCEGLWPEVGGGAVVGVVGGEEEGGGQLRIRGGTSN